MEKRIILTPAELVIVLNIEIIDVEKLLKVTFYDLISKEYILVKNIKLVGDTSKKAFFLFKENIDEEILNSYELLFFSYLDLLKPISLKQLVYSLSNFLNPSYRNISKKYRCEKLVMKSLQDKGILEQKGIIWKKNLLTEKGEKYKEESLNDRISIIKDSEVNYKYLSVLYNILGQNIKLNENDFCVLSTQFNKYFKKGLNRDFLAFPNIGDSYPEPEM